jgi:hypothetical protein
MLDVRPEQHPVSPRRSVRKSDAPRVHNAFSVDRAVELHVRVAADDDVRFHTPEHVSEPFIWRRLEDHLLVAPRRAVAEEDVTQAVDVELHSLGQVGKVLTVPILELVGHPLVCQPLAGILEQRPVRVAANRQGVQPDDQVERLDWKWTGGEVSAEDDRRVACLREDGLERRGIPVDVVERRYP